MPVRSRAARALAVATAATALVVAGGLVVRDPDGPTPAAPADPLATTLSSLDTRTAVVRRQPFCDAVPAAAVRAVTAPAAGSANGAAGGAAATATAWANGDRLPTASGAEVAHEDGCSWTVPDGATASAWVFAPPVTPDRARRLVASASGVKGCEPVAGAAAYGSPSAALSCVDGDRTTVSYRGLFGDAWLVCTLSAPTAAALPELADRWCARVLLAAGEASPGGGTGNGSA